MASEADDLALLSATWKSCDCYNSVLVFICVDNGLWFPTIAEAAAFTRQREAELAELDEEIDYAACGPNALECCKRIESRLRAIRAEKAKGMKETKDGK